MAENAASIIINNTFLIGLYITSPVDLSSTIYETPILACVPECHPRCMVENAASMIDNTFLIELPVELSLTI